MVVTERLQLDSRGQGHVMDITAQVARAGGYHHNQRWGDNNGHAHLRATILGPSLTVLSQEGNLLLGTWQQIVVVDFDIRPRQRADTSARLWESSGVKSR